MAAGIAVWLFGMGIGALNEVVEFAIASTSRSRTSAATEHRGDLVANMLGAAAGAVVVARRFRRVAIRG